MPIQAPRRFVVEIRLDGKWQKEVYTDWYTQALPIALEYIGIHKVRIRNVPAKKVVWESD